jgi:hypothetical protein
MIQHRRKPNVLVQRQVGSELPTVRTGASLAEIAAALQAAVPVFEEQGRAAVSGGVLSIGGALRMVAAKLAPCARMLAEVEGRPSPMSADEEFAARETIAEAAKTIGALAGYFRRAHAPLASYREALSSLQIGDGTICATWPTDSGQTDAHTSLDAPQSPAPPLRLE